MLEPNPGGRIFDKKNISSQSVASQFRHANHVYRRESFSEILGAVVQKKAQENPLPSINLSACTGLERSFAVRGSDSGLPKIYDPDKKSPLSLAVCVLLVQHDSLHLQKENSRLHKNPLQRKC